MKLVGEQLDKFLGRGAVLLVVGIVCLIAGLVGGFIMGANLAAAASKNDLRLLANQKFEDQLSYFSALRREIANLLMTDSPHRFLEIYKRIHAEMAIIERSDRASKDARLKLISDRYPYINEFDPFQTRDYVLYADISTTPEELAKLYEDIHVYVAITKSANRGQWQATTSEKELEHLQKYVRRLEDTVFQHKIAAFYRQVIAFEGFVEPIVEKLDIWEQWHAAIAELHGRGVLFESPEFSAHMVVKMPEDGYGFHFKDVDEHGAVMHFAGDDQFYYSIRRCDANFDETRMLDCLTVDWISVPFKFMARDAVAFK